jgi:hypothetical protein
MFQTKKLIAAIALLISVHARAQDYVVTLQNDTLRGKVTIVNYDKMDKVQIKGEKKKDILSAVHVNSISIAGKTYRPVRTTQTYELMQLMKPGFLSIYLGRRENSMRYEVQYLVRLDGAAIEVPNIGFKKFMMDFLRDCPIVSNKIDQGALGRKNVEQIVDEYNSCLDKAGKAKDSNPVAKNLVEPGDPKLVALDELKSVIQKLTFANQKDAVDIVGDLYEKVRNRQAIPRYLIESLRGLLKDVSEAQPALEKALGLVKAE